MTAVCNSPAKALEGATRPDLKPISISRLGTWAKCQAMAFLRYNLGAKADYQAPHFTVGGTIHQGLEAYYKGEVDSPVEGAMKALKEVFIKHKVEKAFELALEVAAKEREIIVRFEKGEFRKKPTKECPEGEKYTAPRMTTVYKNLVKESGLEAMQEKLQNVTLGDIKLPGGGVAEMVDRVQTLIKRYSKSRMFIPRDHFESLYVEQKFDFVTFTPKGQEVRFLGFMDVFGKLKPEFGGRWVLADYKSGKAHQPEEHQEAADGSPQLTLYEHVLVNLFDIDRKDLDMALHYLDASYPASTSRNEKHFQMLLGMVDTYLEMVDKPGLVKRLFYDSMDCQSCELRSSCVKAFGANSCSAKSTPSLESAPLVAKEKAIEDDLDGIWD